MTRQGITALCFLWAACIADSAASECTAPGFLVSDFKMTDGNADRGFPGGLSLVDVDGDGDLDLYATQGYDVTVNKPNARPSALHINDGKGQFSRGPTSPLTTTAAPTSGSTWADIDGDGDLDAFVATQLGRTDLFYRNLGGGRFEAVDLGDATATKGSNFTASWVDIDGDGDLDLSVGGPTLEPSQPMLLYRNDGGRFVRVTGTPIDSGANNPGAVLWADVDNDGDQDLFVANSDITRKNALPIAPIEHGVLYRNDGSWRFERMMGQAFEDPALPAVTAAFGDVDNDGDLDLFVGLFDDEKGKKRDRLFMNDGHGVFSEARDFVLPEHFQLSTGAAFADFNLDGNLDLIVTSYNAAITLYRGDGQGHFAPVRDDALAKRVSSHWSIVTGDLDGDGRPDAVVGNWGETSIGEFATLLVNDTVACGAWVEIVLRDANGAPNPPGARVVLVTHGASGHDRRQLREASAQTGMRSQSASFFLFGVPEGERIVGAEIRWPDGHRQTVSNLKARERVEVRPER